MTDLQRIRMWAMGCTFSLGEMTLKDREDTADSLVDWVMGAAHEPIQNFREVHGILCATDEVPL